MKKLMLTFVVLFVVLLATSVVFAQSMPPAIFYSNLTSGPNTGGQNSAGAFVTIYGERFGATQGSSFVTIGGGQAASYQSWSNTAVTFQLGSSAKTGSIVVNVGGVASNSVPFTVRAGNIYFVSTSGRNMGSGSYSAPWQTVAYAVSRMSAGSIVYLENGYSSTTAQLTLSTSGTAAAPKAIVAYPNSTATIGSITGPATGISVTGSDWVLSGLTLRAAQTAVSVGAVTGFRLAGNDVSCPNATVSGACIATNGGSSFAFLGNSIHNNGLATSTNLASYEAMYVVNTDTVEIGWNLIWSTLGCNAIGSHASSGAQYSFLIHDNYIYQTPCEAIALGTVNPAQGAVSVYNNIIQSSGTGPMPAGTSQGYEYAAILVGGGSSTPVQVYNNTIYDAGGFGGGSAGAVRALGAVNLVNNIFYLLSTEQYVSLDSNLSSITGTNNLFYGAGNPLGIFSNSVAGNPTFVSLSTNNFHLTAGSPAIDAGATVPLTTDYDGVSRPLGPAYAIGAYEFPSSSSTAAALTITTTSLPAGVVGTPYSTTLAAAKGTAPYTWTDPSCSGSCNTGMNFASTGVLSGTPVNAGTSTFTFMVTDSAGHTATAQLSITIASAAASAAAVSLSPTSLTFASQTVATTSAAQTVTLKNTGSASLTISGIAASGNFAETNTCGSSLAASASCTISVTFTPTAAGTLTGAITFTDNAAASPQQVSLSGTGAAAAVPVVSLSPTSLTFASQTVATTSAAQTVTLTNTGTGSLTISSIAASGNFAETNTCGASLAASASCTISVTFIPTAAGTLTGAITFTDNAAASPQTVSLSGTGAAAAAALAITSTSLPAGVVGTAYSTTLAAANGTAPYTWTDSPCSGSCNTGMNFASTGVLSGTPVNAGTSTFTFTVTDSAGHTATKQLSISIAAAAVSLSPTSLTFASQTVATTSAAQTVTLKNTGAAALSISGIAASGNFAETNTCGSSLAASASCTISVTFTPTAAGTLTGAITFTDNAAASPQQVSLSGTGASSASTPAVSLSSTSLTFASQTVATTSAAQTVTLTNTGTGSLTISSIAASGNFAETNTCGASLAANASCTISVTFTPTAAGTLTGAITFTDNAAASPQQVSLSGTGTTSVSTGKSVALTWTESAGAVSGYNVYRSTQSGTGYAKVNSCMVSPQSYSDGNVSGGQTYYYVVTSVNVLGVESAYSSQVTAVVPAS